MVMINRAGLASPAIWHRIVQLRGLETQLAEKIVSETDEIRGIRGQLDQLKGKKHADDRNKLKVELVDLQESVRLARAHKRWVDREICLTIDHSADEPCPWGDDDLVRLPKTIQDCKRSSIDPDEPGDEDIDAGQAVILTGTNSWDMFVAAEKAMFGRRPESVWRPFVERLEDHGWRTPMASASAMAGSVRGSGLVIPSMPAWLWAGVKSILARLLRKEIPLNEADHAVMVRCLKDVVDRALDDWLKAVGGVDSELHQAVLEAERKLDGEPAPTRVRKAAKSKVEAAT